MLSYFQKKSNGRTGVFDWVWNNKEWIFSGVGVSVAVLLGTFFFRGKKKSVEQKVIGGEGNTQSVKGANQSDAIHQEIRSGNRNSQTIERGGQDPST